MSTRIFLYNQFDNFDIQLCQCQTTVPNIWNNIGTHITQNNTHTALVFMKDDSRPDFEVLLTI